MKNLRSFYKALIETRWNRIVVSLAIATLLIRFLVLWLFQIFDPSFLANNGSLIEGYLIPRLIVIPWKVDWSYGPLTYDLYWTVAQLHLDPLVSSTINFLADACTVYFAAVLSRRFTSPSRSLLTAAAWAFFPLSVFNSIVGQIDALPVLAMIAALYFAIGRKPWLSFLLLALGFNLKLFPILLLPIIVWSHRSDMHLIQLLAGSILPFALGLLLLIPTASLSGFTPTSIATMMLQRFQSRTPSGTSLLNLFEAQFPQSQILSQLLPVVAYLVLVLLITTIVIRKSNKSKSHLVISSGLIIFASVNLSIEVQTNYILWYYLLIVATIMTESRKLYLSTQLCLLALVIVLNNLFAFARLTEISHDTLTATSSLFDLATIGGYQIGSWLLFIFLWRRMRSKVDTG